jgi:hypothetical protein
MATPKSQGVASSVSNSNQTGRIKEDIPTLKNKVIEVLKKKSFFSINSY